MKVWLAASCVTAIAVGAGAAPRAPAGPQRGCAIEGWSIDPDPRGLRVRAGPSLSARELGRLPAFVRDQDGDYGPIFAITGAQNGWLHIADARDAFRPSDLPRRPIYKGAGWVHGSRVRMGVQSGVGYAAPNVKAARTMEIGRNWLSDYGRVEGVQDCSGKWVKVAYAVPAGKPAKGARTGAAWFTGSCGDQRTTCDMADAADRRGR